MQKKSYIINFPLFELTRRVLKGGSISARGILLLAGFYVKLTAAIPFSFLQFLLFSSKIRKTKIIKPPVFIVGHYRSGTTFLHKIMACDERFGFLKIYDMVCPHSNLLFGKTLQRILQYLIDTLKIKTAFFNNVIPQLSEPTEEDRYMISRGSAFSPYWGFVFPKTGWLNFSYGRNDRQFLLRWKEEYIFTLKFITSKNAGKQLILKNPPNTERIDLLLEMFPDAKFIYISRNPIHVFYSMRNMWKKAIMKNYCLQDLTEQELENLIIDHFNHLLQEFEKQSKLIPEKNLTVIQYEALEANPYESIKKIYTTLELPDFEAASENIRKQLQIESGYKKFNHPFNKETTERISEKWAQIMSGEYIKAAS